jgi:hypothetical protein
MKVVVTRHYPAWKLPADLRENFDPSALVTVIVEETDTKPGGTQSGERIETPADKQSQKD